MKRLLVAVLCLILLTGCGAETPEVKTEPVRIAVIDTGFSQAIPAEKTASGYNYLNLEAGTEDTYGHGTAVASVILDRTSNVILLPLVCSAYEKGYIQSITPETMAQCIRDAVDVYQCHIINISAGYTEDDPSLRQAVEYVSNKGALIVASAGNDQQENPGQVYYPAAYPQVLAVGALNGAMEGPADFSQQGEWVDCYGPGTEISVLTLSGKRTTENGCSYAAAAVSAMAAELLQKQPGLSAEALRQMLLEQGNLLR